MLLITQLMEGEGRLGRTRPEMHGFVKALVQNDITPVPGMEEGVMRKASGGIARGCLRR